MRSEIYWLESTWPGKISVAPRPRGDDWTEEDIAIWKRAGVDVVLSLLTPAEEKSLGLRNERDVVSGSGLQFFSFPIPDLQVPRSKAKLGEILERLGNDLAEGKNVLIHCRQGIGRSGLVAACLLISKGLAPEAAVDQVSKARGQNVPETPEQREWVDRFAAKSSARRYESSR